MPSPIADVLHVALGPLAALPPTTAPSPAAVGGVPGGPELLVILLVVLLPVALLVLVVLGIAGVRVFGDGDAGDRGRQRGQDPALEELRLALARGDIGEEEFERRRNLLEDSAPGAADRDRE